MTKTNHELAREAAGVLWKQDRQTFESVTRIIADTYAEATRDGYRAASGCRRWC